MVVYAGTRQLGIFWNLIRENSEDNNITNSQVLSFIVTKYCDKIQVFSLPYGFTVKVDLEFNILQSFSCIEQGRSINNFYLN